MSYGKILIQTVNAYLHCTDLFVFNYITQIDLVWGFFLENSFITPVNPKIALHHQIANIKK